MEMLSKNAAEGETAIDISFEICVLQMGQFVKSDSKYKQPLL